MAKRRVKLAIVGCGNMGHSHGHHLQENADAQVVALCDPSRDQVARLHREKFHSDSAIRVYDTYESLLQDPPEGLEGVLILTPHTQHFAQCMAALDKGWAVLVEKPMVTESDHARQLAEKIGACKGKLQVAFNSTFTQEFAYIRDTMRSGGLGEMQTVTAFSCQGWRKWTEGSWRQDPAMSGGGQMYDTGAHVFNSLMWLMDTPATEVFCWADAKGMAIDINAAVTIKWRNANGSTVLGSVTISGNTPGWQEGIWLAGDKGRIATGIHGGWIDHFDEKGNRIKYPSVTQEAFTPSGNFVAWLLGKAEPRCPVRYGVLHSWLMDGIYDSARSGQPVILTKPPC